MIVTRFNTKFYIFFLDFLLEPYKKVKKRHKKRFNCQNFFLKYNFGNQQNPEKCFCLKKTEIKSIRNIHEIKNNYFHRSDNLDKFFFKRFKFILQCLYTRKIGRKNIISI